VLGVPGHGVLLSYHFFSLSSVLLRVAGAHQADGDVCCAYLGSPVDYCRRNGTLPLYDKVETIPSPYY
jgi:hypothetical protein